MTRFLLLLFFLATITLIPLATKAAHLVGGHITYTCQGNNVYQFNLRIYRDCAGGGANFDNQAIITVFNSQGNIVVSQGVPRQPTVPVNPNPNNNPCLIVPSGLCTEYAEYVVSFNLPPIAGGYTISHQRCCRNGTISNLVNPGSVGNTYTVQIPSMDTTCNNSPQITAVAPTILCLNEALNLPIQTTEADGDSIYFDLCDIFTGGGQSGGSGCNAVVPNPACPPPYSPVTFIAGSSAQNPMPSSPAFGIDPQTGVIFGTPTLIGQFVVGICVSEYRNGQLLSTVRFDYQFNVNNCGSPIANFVTPVDDPTILCDGLTVQFIAQPINATSVLWDFGVPGITTDTSTQLTSTFTYPAPGNYLVSLVAFQGTACSDTFQFLFEVVELINVDISYSGINCFEVQDFVFEPVGFWPANTSFNWQFSAGANISSFNGLITPPISWSTPGTHQVQLNFSWGPGCSDTLFETITVSNLSLSVNAGPDQTLSPGQTANLFAVGGLNYFWYSNLPAYFSNQFAQSTSTIPLADTTIYYVEVTDEFGCKGLDSLFVYVLRPPKEGVMNVITPNGDSKNDVLDLKNVTLNDPCRFVVMDRWGKQVYEQNPYTHLWDGASIGGQPLPDGTYYFLVQFNDELRFRGPVTIIRNKE